MSNSLARDYIREAAECTRWVAESLAVDQGEGARPGLPLALPRLLLLRTSDRIGPQPPIHSSNKKPCPSPRDPTLAETPMETQVVYVPLPSFTGRYKPADQTARPEE